MHFGFALDLSDIDLLNIDLLDQRYTHLDLLDTDIPSKHFVCLQDVLKTSSRYVFKTSSRHVFKTSSRHVFKTSSRRLGRRKIVTLKTCWRRLQDMFWRRLEDQQMFAGIAPISVSWEIENLTKIIGSDMLKRDSGTYVCTLGR